jgi:hypothetical protein
MKSRYAAFAQAQLADGMKTKVSPLNSSHHGCIPAIRIPKHEPLCMIGGSGIAIRDPLKGGKMRL